MKKLMFVMLVVLSSCNKYHKYHYGSFYSKPTKREINKAMRAAQWQYEQPKVKIYIH